MGGNNVVDMPKSKDQELIQVSDKMDWLMHQVSRLQMQTEDKNFTSYSYEFKALIFEQIAAMEKVIDCLYRQSKLIEGCE